MYPAAYPEAIAVAAVDSDLHHAELLEHRLATSTSSAPGVGIVVDVGQLADRVRVGERYVDGDAVRVGRRRARSSPRTRRFGATA